MAQAPRLLLAALAALAAGLAAAPAAAHPAWGIAVDGQGRVTFSEVSSNTVWRIADGHVTPVVRQRHSHEIWQDAQGAVFGEDLTYDAPRDRWLTGFWRRDPSGRLAELLPRTAEPPAGLGPLHDRAGNSYAFAWPRGERRDTVLFRRSPDGAVTRLAGGFTGICGKAWGPDGSLYVADGAAVRRITPGGAVTTLGGDPLAGVGHGAHPRLLGVAVTPGGSVLVADYDHGLVREIMPDGRVVDRWRSGLFWSPAGVAVAQGAVYLLEARPEAVSLFLEQLGPWVRVRRIDPGGTVTLLAVVGRSGLQPALLGLAALLAAAVALAIRRRRARRSGAEGREPPP